jgi:ADP-ribosylarginine hydrolase
MRYVGADQRDELIAIAVESGRMTHNHPVAILGGVASALFAAYAIEGMRKQ